MLATRDDDRPERLGASAHVEPGGVRRANRVATVLSDARWDAADAQPGQGRGRPAGTAAASAWPGDSRPRRRGKALDRAKTCVAKRRVQLEPVPHPLVERPLDGRGRVVQPADRPREVALARTGAELDRRIHRDQQWTVFQEPLDGGADAAKKDGAREQEATLDDRGMKTFASTADVDARDPEKAPLAHATSELQNI